MEWRAERIVSAAADTVMVSFGNFMGALANTDPSLWEPEEIIAFADGIAQVHGVMQVVKDTVLSHAE